MARRSRVGIKRVAIRQRARGVLLLEALLALLFIAICLGAVASLFSSSLARIRQARLRTRALMLAETKLAEMQLGLAEITEGTEGDFDDRPKGFFWSYTMDPTDMPEMSRLALTIHYDDPADGFDYSVYRYFSPGLNYSYEELNQIATDPSRLQEMESPGFKELLAMLGESDIPGGEGLIKALMAGGVNEMIGLYNKLLTGRVLPEELMSEMAATGSAEADEDETGGLTGMLGWAEGVGGCGPVWSNGDTAEGVEEIELAKANEESTEGPTVDGEAQPTVGEDEGKDEKPGGRRGSRRMSQRQAMQQIMRMLGRMARERK